MKKQYNSVSDLVKDISKSAEVKKKVVKKIKPEKVIKFNIEKMERDIKKDRKKHPVKYFIKDMYNTINNFCQDSPMITKRFIQRGKRGFGSADVWSLDSYLSDVIEHSVIHLKKNLNGHPPELTEGQWVDILNSISYTFNLAKECSSGDLVLMRDKKDREKFDMVFTNKNEVYRYMTMKEMRDYDLGWKNLKTYFLSLWD